MICATSERSTSHAACVRLLLILGLVAVFCPTSAALGGTRRRANPKPAPNHKAHAKAKHVRGTSVPAPPFAGVSIASVTSVAAARPTSSSTLAPAVTPNAAEAPPAGAAVVAPTPVFATSSSTAGTDVDPEDPTPPIEQQIFALTNQARQANDLVALTIDPELTQAAQIQATAMALVDVMDHELPSMPQPTFSSRLQFVGYRYSWAAENLAFAAPDAPTLVALWLGSPAHEQNIMSPIAMATGIAVAYDSQGVPYFCQVFGEPR